jgi:hypothetical protein
LTPLGDENDKAIIAIANTSASSPLPRAMQQLLQVTQGAKPRLLISRTAETVLLGYNKTTQLSKDLLFLGACTFMAHRMCMIGLLSRLAADVELGLIIPIAMFTYFLSDVTDMNMCMRKKTTKFHMISHINKQVELCKILQSELWFAFLVRNQTTKRLEFIVVNFPCILRVGNRSTGEVLKQQIIDTMRIPMLASVRARFSPNCFDLGTADKGANNLRCEASFRVEAPGSIRLLGFCILHC